MKISRKNRERVRYAQRGKWVGCLGLGVWGWVFGVGGRGGGGGGVEGEETVLKLALTFHLSKTEPDQNRDRANRSQVDFSLVRIGVYRFF